MLLWNLGPHGFRVWPPFGGFGDSALAALAAVSTYGCTGRGRRHHVCSQLQSQPKQPQPSLPQPPQPPAAAVVTHTRAVFMLQQHPKHEAHTGSSPHLLRVRGSEGVTRRRAFNPRSVPGLEQNA